LLIFLTVLNKPHILFLSFGFNLSLFNFTFASLNPGAENSSFTSPVLKKKIHSSNLSGFSKSEIDSIEYTFFEKGSQFQKKTGKSFIEAASRDSIGLPLQINSQDLQIRVIKTNTKFQFTDYVLGHRPCNFCLVGSDDFEVIESLKLNGKSVKTDSFIELKK
jgi:hypothetical protein